MFVNLHCHDEYSVLDGFGSTADFVARAAELEQPALAITNHANIDSAFVLKQECAKHNIKPIFGAELYVVPDIKEKTREKNYHVVVLVQNETGWNNLLQILSIAHTEGFYYKPRISPYYLYKHNEGLLFLSGCSNSIIHTDWGIEFLKRVPVQNVYMEIMPVKMKEQIETNKKALELSERFNWEVVATNDAHYPDADSAVLQEVSLAIQTKAKWNDQKRFKFSVEGLYIKSETEMLSGLLEMGVSKTVAKKAINTTLEIANRIQFDLSQKEIQLPKLYETDSETVLKKKCIEKLKQKELYENPIYKNRLHSELKIILQKPGFADYLLIVEELVDWCKENDILVGPGRGSSGGSLMCWLLNITVPDPIEHGLLFSRFIAPDRNDLPDIDIDFEDRKRYRVIEHLTEKYGADCVAGVSTYSRLGARGIIRDVARVFSLPFKTVDVFCKQMNDAISLKENVETTDYGAYFKNEFPPETTVAVAMENTVRHKSQHAAGIVVSAQNLKTSGQCYLQRAKENCKNGVEFLVNWDKTEIEYFGLMKLDILGLSALTVLSEIKSMVQRNHKKNIDFYSIPMNEKKVFDKFRVADTIGVHQFSADGMREFLKELKVETFNDIVCANALFRPGPLSKKMHTEYARRKNGIGKYEERHEKIFPVLKDTYGIIIYQEQIMELANTVAGLPWKIADEIRKIIGKSKGAEAIEKYKNVFVNGCVETSNLKRETAIELWEEIVGFGAYGFNKSHAVEYSIISYWQMWLKVNYPLEFYAASLTYTDEDRKKQLLDELRGCGYSVRLPVAGKSDPAIWLVHDGILYCPFIEIIGMGETQAEKTRGLKEAVEFKRAFTTKWLSTFLDLGIFEDRELTNETAMKVQDLFKLDFYW
jgi:DNA polymerase-3 subunit alpha